MASEKPIIALSAALTLAAPDGAAVRQSRLQSGLNQAEMASALGLSNKSRISDYESDKSPMPAITWALWLLISGQHPRAKILARN